MVQVGAELPAGYTVFEVAVARRDHLEVDFQFPVTAHAADPAVLDGLEQFRLEIQVQLAEFVKKQGAAIGLLDEPPPPVPGAREGPCLVAEQFGLEQFPRERGAIDFHQRTFGSRTGMVKDACDQTLPGTGFAADQQRRKRYPGESCQHVAHVFCRRTVTDECCR